MVSRRPRLGTPSGISGGPRGGFQLHSKGRTRDWSTTSGLSRPEEAMVKSAASIGRWRTCWECQGSTRRRRTVVGRWRGDRRKRSGNEAAGDGLPLLVLGVVDATTWWMGLRGTLGGGGNRHADNGEDLLVFFDYVDNYRRMIDEEDNICQKSSNDLAIA